MLSSAEFDALFREFQHSARRLESRGRYRVAEEQPRLRAFLDGKLPETYQRDPDWWTDNVAEKTSAGKAFQRVRVLHQPLTDYNRYMLYTCSRNAGAGEDIRYLHRERANELDLPDHDFWIFDSTTLVLLRFTADDRWLGPDLVTEPDVVARHDAWVRLALEQATPYRDYVAEDPSRVLPPVRLGRPTPGGT